MEWLKVKGWTKSFQANGNEKKGVAIVRLGKLKFQTKSRKMDRKGSIGEWKKVLTSHLGQRCTRHEPFYISQNSIKIYHPPLNTIRNTRKKIIKITTIVEYFNLPFSEFIRSSRPNINKVIKDLNAIFKSLDMYKPSALQRENGHPFQIAT